MPASDEVSAFMAWCSTQDWVNGVPGPMEIAFSAWNAGAKHQEQSTQSPRAELLTARIKELVAENQELKEENKALQYWEETRKRVVDNLGKDVREYKTENEELRNQVEYYSKAKYELEAQLQDSDHLRERVSELNTRLKELRSECSDAWDKCDERRIENKTLTGKLEKADAQVVKHGINNAALRAELKELESEKQNLVSQRDELSTELEDLKHLHANQAVTIDAYQNENKRLSTELKEAQAQVVETNTKLYREGSRRKQFEQENAELKRGTVSQGQYDKLEMELSSVRTELSTRIKELMRQNIKLMKEKVELEIRLSTKTTPSN